MSDESDSESVKESEVKVKNEKAKTVDKGDNDKRKKRGRPPALKKEETDDKKKKKNEVVTIASDDDDFVTTDKKKKKKGGKKCPLLTINLDDSDEDEDSSSKNSNNKKKNEKKKKKTRLASSDDDVRETDGEKSSASSDEEEEDDDKSDASSSFEAPKKGRRKGGKKKKSSSGSEEEDSDAPSRKRKKRKRIKDVKSSDEDGEEDSDADTPNKGRKNIRRVIKDKNLTTSTKQAAKDEEDRKRRVENLQKKYNMVTEGVDTHGYEITTKLVLESDPKTKEETVCVDPKLIKKLKPHQVEGVKFLWGSVIESVDRAKDSPGSGCILAHCMGLGKTLQVISFIHTLLNHESVGIEKVLVVCPVNTILNWVQEFDIWLNHKSLKIDVYELSTVKNNWNRADKLNTWFEDGGVMVMGYDMFRTLAQEKGKRINKKQRTIFSKALIDPGPDLVICDEGHILKNSSTALSKAMNRISTLKRVVLTGTPLQNNLNEYHCMVSFVKPNLLGTGKEFKNRFVNPITNGQCADSTGFDVRLMKRRAHILHNLLDGCVQRRDYNVLTPFLQPKHEYVISIRLSEIQVKLYQHFMDNFCRGKGSFRSGVFSDYQGLMKIWTHPWVLRLAEIRDENKVRASNDSEDSFIDDSTPETSENESDGEKKNKKKGSGSSGSEPENSEDEVISKWKSRTRSGRGKNDDGAGTSKDSDVTMAPIAADATPPSRGWWTEYIKEDAALEMELSGKLVLLFDILQSCNDIGDKVLIFSQSLLSLNLIEEMLERLDSKAREEAALAEDKAETEKNTWVCGQDYFRMDGSTPPEQRKRACEVFNDESNYRARLFLISTRAGGLGITLVAANRVIVFDASWNPTHDVQSIFRVYRFGQKKPVYIYRFLAQGTMEEKIYDRQVTKQSLACRVVDEQQIERHFNAADLAELYAFEPDSRNKNETPLVPKDRLLAELIIRRKEWIVGYHEHDSLLQNKEDENLSEEERKTAWEEYEAEKKGLFRAASAAVQYTNNAANAYSGMAPNIDVNRIIGIIQQQNPGLTPTMLVAKVQNTIIQLRTQQRWVGVQAVQLRQQNAEMDKIVKLENQVQSYTYLIVSLEKWLQTIVGRFDPHAVY